jgi:RNA polymerase sigma-70 factor (ECF subfamily)
MLASQPAIPSTSSTPLECLFRDHHARVFRVAYRVTGNASDAEDVLQTVFLRLARQAEVGSIENPASYLYRAAQNAALDVLRQRRSAEPLEAAEGAEAGRAADARVLLDVADLGRALRSALTRLHPRAAEMFTLRYFEGHDNRQIACQMKTSSAVVAVTLFRARRQLKDDLRRSLGERR